MTDPKRILEKLDAFLSKNDYESAERHLLYWKGEAERTKDIPCGILVYNELMGLYRKLSKKEQALSAVDSVLEMTKKAGVGEQVGAATTYLNAATVYKAFSMPDKSLPLFERAREIYLRELPEDDGRLGGLYNNMALCLVDLKRFDEADELYEKAISVMEKLPDGDLEVAISYLNMASAAEARYGALDADERIQELLEKAKNILDSHEKRDGYYAFVCEKCASVYGYYGHFMYKKELDSRSERIYGN